MSQESLVQPFHHSYTLSVTVDELDSSYSIRVTDSTTVSTLISDLVNRIHLKFNWTEFGLWHKSKKIWLLPKSSNLSQFILHSDSDVHFIRRYRMINIQLPDLQIREMMLDLSKTVFQTSHIVCRKMGIRHHEEVSFQYRLKNNSKYRSSSLVNVKRKTHFESNQDILHSSFSLRRNVSQFSPKKREGTSFFRSFSNNQNNNSPKLRQKTSTIDASMSSFNSTYENTIDKSFNDSIYHEGFENSKLENSPEVTCEDALRNGDVLLFKTYKERSTLRFPWMVSELNLMEQGIEDFDDILLLLRFKYHNYFYLDEKYDRIRINQIFNQARWSVLSNETDCSEDEALILGAILLQIKRSLFKKSNDPKILLNGEIKNNTEEEINIILDKLYLELLGRYDDEIEELDVEISGSIQLVKYPKRIFNSTEKHFAEMKNDGIHLFQKRKIHSTSKSTEVIPVEGNEIELRIKFSKKEYYILEIINLQSKSELYKKENKFIEKYKLKFLDKNECIRWAAGCRLLAKSIDFTKVTNFQYEFNIVTNIFDMKRPLRKNSLMNQKEQSEEIILSDYLSPRINKAFKKKLYLGKLVQFQKSYSHYSLIQGKIAFIKCWLTLRNAGVCYFQTSLNNNVEKELFGVGYNRLINSTVEDGKLKRIWELSKLVTWDTNWELLYITLQFPNEKFRLGFMNMSECQTFHEYLGGYLFIMMRNSEKYSDLSEKVFRKLTARNITGK